MSDATRADVLEQYRQECSFLLYGSCSTVACLRRGGYEKGKIEGVVPTCAAKEAVEAAPPAVWSREKPTEPGWYFYRWNGQSHTIVQLAQVDTGSRYILERVHEDGTFRPLLPSTLDEWSSSPLRPPVEGNK